MQCCLCPSVIQPSASAILFFPDDLERACRMAREKPSPSAVFMLRSFSCHLETAVLVVVFGVMQEEERLWQAVACIAISQAILLPFRSLQAYMSDRECEGWVGITYQHKASQRMHEVGTLHFVSLPKAIPRVPCIVPS